MEKLYAKKYTKIHFFQKSLYDRSRKYTFSYKIYDGQMPKLNQGKLYSYKEIPG